MVKAKFIIYKWKKVVKDEKKWFAQARHSMTLYTLKEIYSTWILMSIKAKVKVTVRDKYLKIKSIRALKTAKGLGDDEKKIWGQTTMLRVFKALQKNKC